MQECKTPVHNTDVLNPENIKDPIYQALLNTDGIFMIGDTISYVTPNTEFVITDGDLSKVDILRNHRDAELENVITFILKDQNKSTSLHKKSYDYEKENNSDSLHVEVELWFESYFWRRTSFIEVDLVHAESTNDREKMAYCYLDITGKWGITKNGSTNWKNESYSGAEYNCWEHQEKMFYKGWTSGILCSKDVEIDITVRRSGESNQTITSRFTAKECH